MIKLIDTGTKYGIPTLAVTGVGADMTRDERYFSLATRICAEIGAHYVKSYYFEPGFERVVAGCPVPIVIAGGKKLPERDALEMAYRAIDQGAAGVDMGRNVFQSDCIETAGEKEMSCSFAYRGALLLIDRSSPTAFHGRPLFVDWRV